MINQMVKEDLDRYTEIVLMRNAFFKENNRKFDDKQEDYFASSVRILISLERMYNIAITGVDKVPKDKLALLYSQGGWIANILDKHAQ